MWKAYLIRSTFLVQRHTRSTRMGRKLIRRAPTEKDSSSKWPRGQITIVVAQHLLFYSSGYVIASTAFLVHNGTFTKYLLPIAVILVFAVCLPWYFPMSWTVADFIAGLCITSLHRAL